MDYVIVIPSYNRTKMLTEKTLATLKSYKVPTKRIYVFVANKEQLDLYKSEVPSDLYGHMMIAEKGLTNARNFITDYFPEGKHIVSFDDDVSEFVHLVGKKLQRLPSFEKMVEAGFELCKKHKRRLWGIYPTANPFYMSHTVSTDLKFIVGHFWGVINTKEVRVSMDYKEDYERTLKFAVRDGGTIRFNNVAAKTKLGAPGGIGASAKERVELNKGVSKRLMEMFPGLVRLNPRRPGEILLARKIPDTYKGKGKAMDDPQDDKVSAVPIRNKDAYETAKSKFLEEVRKITVPKIPKTQYYESGKVKVMQRDLLIGNIGRTMNFGFLKTRAGYKDAVNNRKHPELFDALIDIGNQVVPKGWKYSTITLNHNMKAKKHIDGVNIGDSVIVAVGDFTGGGLYTYKPNGSSPTLHNIKDKPAMFNGAILPHRTQAFKGERYTMIFFNQKKGAEVKGKTMVGKGDEEDLEGGVTA
jgi:hypothetical protein